MKVNWQMFNVAGKVRTFAAAKQRRRAIEVAQRETLANARAVESTLIEIRLDDMEYRVRTQLESLAPEELDRFDENLAAARQGVIRLSRLSSLERTFTSELPRMIRVDVPQ